MTVGASVAIVGVSVAPVTSVPFRDVRLTVGGTGAGTPAHHEIRGGHSTHVGGLWAVVD